MILNRASNRHQNHNDIAWKGLLTTSKIK